MPNKKKKRSGATQRTRKIEKLAAVASLMERHGQTKHAITFRFSSRVIKAHQAKSRKCARRLAHLQGSPSRKMSAVRMAPSITKTPPRRRPTSMTSPIHMTRTSQAAPILMPSTSKASLMPPSTSKASLASPTAISGI